MAVSYVRSQQYAVTMVRWNILQRLGLHELHPWETSTDYIVTGAYYDNEKQQNVFTLTAKDPRTGEIVYRYECNKVVDLMCDEVMATLLLLYK